MRGSINSHSTAGKGSPGSIRERGVLHVWVEPGRVGELGPPQRDLGANAKLTVLTLRRGAITLLLLHSAEHIHFNGRQLQVLGAPTCSPG